MKNQLNGFLGLLGAVTCVFASSSAFAQTTGSTNVPFIGGRINITIPTAGPVIFNSGTGVTPLGTVSFTGFSSSTDYRNLTTGASATTTGSRADQVGDSIATIGNSSGSISITSNGTSFTFTDRATDALGNILSITTVSAGRTIDNSISGGSISLPTALLNLSSSSSPPTGSTDVPFTGGNFNIDVANSGSVRFNSGSAVTPLGTVTFSASNFNNFLNRRTALVNTASGNNVNDLIVFTGQNVSGTFGSLANSFTNAPATILGKIAANASTASGVNLTNTITSGVINLPNSVVGIEANSGFPIVGGNFFVRSNTKDFAEITVGFNTLVTSVGTVRVKVDSTSLSTLFAPSLNYQIKPGTFTPYVEPANIDAIINKTLDISGFTSGTLGYRFSVNGIFTQTNVDFSNSIYNVQGRIRTANDVNPEINVDITGGNIFFPTASIINAEQTATQAVQQGLEERANNNNPNVQTNTGVVTITTPSKSAVASSSVHPDVTNIPAIQVKSEQLRSNTGSLLGQNRISEAFSSIESGQNSLLSTFTGVNLKSRVLTIDESLKEVTRLSQLSNSQTAVIYPVILKDRLEILAILPGIPPSQRTKGTPARTFRTSVAVPEEALVEIIARFRDNLQDPLSSDYLVESKLLYNLLIRPIEAELQASEIKTLVFAMDGDFRSIPTAALNDGNKFLIQKYATATVPSLGMANTNLSTVTSKRATTILALGLTDSVQGFSALPNVKTEIVTIGSKILSGQTFLNQEFTVENLQAQRRKQDYGIIHLATHAEFDVDDAQDSFVLFWDKKVRSGQIPKLRLDKLELLTLSACQTAVGNNLGLSGLAVSSGVKSVLASLWSVSDAGTAPLMMKFYSLYPDALSKAIALQKAQIALIEGNVKIENKSIKGIPEIGDVPLAGIDQNINLKHPYFWSSFTLIGNWL
jgi:CHAT domain-containing protein